MYNFRKWISFIDKDILHKALKYIDINKNLCPKSGDTFKAFVVTPFYETNVILLGQDPYPQIINNKPVATGLAFANSTDTINISQSLKILKTALADPKFPRINKDFDVSLEYLAQQGVLLLNSALTCESGKPNSHVYLWRPVIIDFLKNIGKYDPDKVYILLGKQAQSFKKFINGTIVEDNHPAWYARQNKVMDYTVFKQTNQILYNKGYTPIKWY